MGKFDAVLHSNEVMIPNNLISEAINKLECGKSAGHDGAYAEATSNMPIRDYMFYFLFVLVYVLHMVICVKI